MDAFIYDPQGTSGNNDSTPVLNNGKVDLPANKDGWKQGLAYINSLYDAGLIDKSAFTQNPDALKAIGDNSGTVILGAATVLHPAIFFTPGSPDGRDKQYDAVPPPKGPDGNQATGYKFPSAPGATFVLTNKASKEAQIASIKMLDYTFTQEGEIKGLFGTDDRTVVKPSAGNVPLEGTTALYKQIPLPAGAVGNNTGWSALANTTTPKNSGRVKLWLPTSMPRPVISGGCLRRPSCRQGRKTRPRSTRTGASGLIPRSAAW